MSTKSQTAPATVTAYQSQHKIRIVTAASLFDGHDAAINIMRRILQASGAEVIHLGHNRSVDEVVNAAIQEDAQAIAMTSYQGGHVEYLKYMYDLLNERGAAHIRIFAGGGGTILPTEIEELHAYGITRVYHPDDGRSMGLQGMINDVLEKCDFATWAELNGESKELRSRNPRVLARTLTVLENDPEQARKFIERIQAEKSDRIIPVLGITGTGGAGKSSMVDELVRRYLRDFEDRTIAVLSVDPSKRKTGGALLGDRIRMNSINHPRVYMRSFATRAANIAMTPHVVDAIEVMRAADFDLIIVETAGIGQSDTEITTVSDVSMYLMTPEFGAASQLEKIDMLDFADVVAINKFDKRGAEDALRDVRKQYQRNHQRFGEKTEDMPVYGTIASQFNDPGTTRLYRALMDTIVAKTGADLRSNVAVDGQQSEKIYIIPPDRTRYLAEIAEESDRYDTWVERQAAIARRLYQLKGSIEVLKQLQARQKDESE